MACRCNASTLDLSEHRAIGSLMSGDLGSTVSTNGVIHVIDAKLDPTAPQRMKSKRPGTGQTKQSKLTRARAPRR